MSPNRLWVASGDFVYSSERLMEDSMSTPLARLWLLLLVPLMRLLLHVASRSRRRRSNDKPKQLPLPPSPPGLPIVGHLHLVGDSPQVSFRDLATAHGGGSSRLMLLHLGAVRNLVVSTPRAAQTVLRTHDHAFASRPVSTLVDDLAYGSSSVAFAPYGEHWRQIRKLITTHLFTAKKVRSYRHARQEEVRLVVARLREAATAGVEVDVSEMATAYANNIVCRAVCGKFFRVEGRNKIFRELNHATTVLLAGFNVEDYFPWLANFLRTSRFWSNKKARDAQRRWDELLEKIISDHERQRISKQHRQGGTAGSDDEQEGSTDFIDVMLSVQEEYGITRDHIKAILVDMFEAGNGTSSSVLEFAMAELMLKPHCMTKLQAEMREKIPRDKR